VDAGDGEEVVGGLGGGADGEAGDGAAFGEAAGLGERPVLSQQRRA
jgi:hypothetical protein